MSEHDTTSADPMNSRIEDADVCEHEGIKRRKLTPPCDDSLTVVVDHVAAFLVHERLEPDELDLLVAIINEHPELAMRKFVHKCGTQDDHLLYHLCKFKPSLDHIRTVYAAFPFAIQVIGLCNLLPLHAYIAAVEDPDIIEFLVNEYPNALEHQTDYRMTPIHLLQHSNFTTPEITQVLVKKCPEVVLQRCELGTALHLALLSRSNLTDEADLFLNEESLKIMAEACPTALRVLHYGKESQFELRQLPLFALLDGKPTMDLVELFVSGFSAALRIEARDEYGAIINILQCALRDSRLSIGIKRSLIRGSVLGHKMVLSLYELSAEVATAIIEEADAHPMVNELELSINASRYAVSDTTHSAMIEALAVTTSLTRFWYVPNAFTTRLRLPDSSNKLLSNFFAQNTPVEDLKLGLSYHSSAFEGLAKNSYLRELKVSIQDDSTDDLAGLASALKVNDTISTVILHTDTTATPWPLLDAFKTNTTLKRFYMHGPPLPTEFSDALLEVLATRNVTLQHCVCGNREERIDHYCSLNRTGRRIIRKPGTTKAEFVNLIRIRIDNVNILFGLLLDSPALWST